MGEPVRLPPIEYAVNDIDHAGLIWMLRTMMRIREFEERVADLVQDKRVLTPCHLYTGQEAVATGVAYALSRDDYVFGSHRAHGQYLAKGGDLKAAMAEIFGRATGCSKGRGGSMHLAAPQVGIMGTSSIVAGALPISVGAALAESIRKTGRISVIFHGDGVPEEGIWHESANFAALRRLPSLFVCENNGYCTHMPMDRRRRKDNLSEMAAAHGFTTRMVDGNNVLEVYYAAREAVAMLRKGEGPVFLECRTYRWRGHVGCNYDVDLGLRSDEELAAWMERCPIKHFAQFLMDELILSEAAYEILRNEVKAEIEDAVKFAEASPYPEVSELGKYVYKE